MYKFLMETIFQVHQLDEIKKKKLDYLGNYLFMINMLLIVINLVIIALGAYLKFSNGDILTYFIVSIVAIFLLEWCFVAFYVNRLKLNIVRLKQSEIKQYRHKLKVRGWVYGIIASIFFIISYHEPDNNPAITNILNNILSPAIIFYGCTFGSLLGVMYFIRNWKNVRKIDGKEDHKVE